MVCARTGLRLGVAVAVLLAVATARGDEVATAEELPPPVAPPLVVEDLHWWLERLEEERMADPLPGPRLGSRALRDRPALGLGDAMVRLPGVYTGGPPGEDRDLRLRGLDKEFSRIEVNGITLPDPGEKREFRLDRMPVSLVESVRVLRSPAAEHDSDGIAGRVLVRTRGVPEEDSLSVRHATGGSGDGGTGRRGSLSLALRLGDGVGFRSMFDGIDIPAERTKTKVSSDGTVEREREREDLPTTSIAWDLGWRAGKHEFHLRPMLLRTDAEKDKVKVKTAPGKAREVEREFESKRQSTAGMQVAHAVELSADTRIESMLGRYEAIERKDKDKTKLKVKSGSLAVDSLEREHESKSDGFVALQSALETALGGAWDHRLKTGLSLRLRDREREKRKVTRKPGGAPVDATGPKDNYSLDEDYRALFVQDTFDPAEDLTLLPGVRWETVRQEGTSGTGLRDEARFSDVNPSLHALWRAGDAWNLRASVARTVNRPKFDDLSPYIEEKGDRFTVGNPDLQPARAWGLDVGAEWAGPSVFLGVNLFHRRVRGVLEEVDTGEVRSGKPVHRVENVGDGFIRGIEFDQRIDAGRLVHESLDGLGLWANASFLDSRLRDASGDARPFKDQPRRIVNVGIDYDNPTTGTLVALAWRRVGEVVNDEASGKRKSRAAENAIDLLLRQRIHGGLSVYVECLNLGGVVRTESERTPGGPRIATRSPIPATVLFGIQIDL